MSVLLRSDGTPFVVQAYRETILADKKTLFQHKLTFRAKQQGSYACVMPLSGTEYTVAFSQDAGFLLGNCIREQFSEQDNIIFCEACPDDTYLVVVIKKGVVIFDNQLAVDHITEELIPFLLDASYHFYVHGDMPFSVEEEDNKLQLPEACIEAFNVLESSVFETLPTEPQYELVSLQAALQSVKFSQNYWRYAIFGIILAVLVLILWLGLSPTEPVVPVQHKSLIKVNEYDRYRMQLRTPSPAVLLTELAHTIEDLYFAPGWNLTYIRYKNGRYTAHYDTETGSVEVMNEWAKSNHYQFKMRPNGVSIVVLAQAKNRVAPDHVYKLKQVSELLIDELNVLTRGKHVQIAALQTYGALKMRQITVMIQGASSDSLLLLAKTFKGLPVKLDTVDLNLANGLLTGSIRFDVWGN